MSAKKTVSNSVPENIARVSQIQVSDLDKFLFFTELTKLEKHDILPKLCFKNHLAGEIICKAEDQNTDVFFICEGDVEISLETDSGQHVFFESIGKGEYFGEFAAIDGNPRSALVRAQTVCKLLRMQREVFLSVLITHPKLAIRLMERLTAIAREGNQKIFDMATLTVVERLYNWFCDIGAFKDGRIVVKNTPSQIKIAAQLGTTRETVSRSMNKLIADSIITRGDSCLYVRPKAKIRKY